MRVDLNKKQANSQIKTPVISIQASGKTKARVSVNNPVGLGRIEIFVNGKRTSSVSIRSKSDRKLSAGRYVQSVTLRTKRNNTVVVKVNGKVIQQMSFQR